ncbi:tryptamine hydroxycinnamoyltransferase 1-like [Aristolochia californica]|uniref:tryptamine hydroxycinnamoyltransferase 1-like n=1 Tax=Aristolochia californica TaxID=171875 RepID=UPI0035D833DC
MALEIVNNTILKPYPSSINPHTNVTIPLTIFDRAAFDLHVSVLYAFRPPMPSNEAMMQGLAQVLNIYPHLAGRFTVDEQGRPCILLNGAGVRIVETRIGTTLAESLPFEPSHELTNLHPPIEGVEELLQIQLNRYTCGGLVIGQTAHHRVADGQSMSYFFAAWARSVRGLDVEVLPYHNRAAVSIPRNLPMCEFNHRAIEFKEHKAPPVSASIDPSSPSIVNLVIHYSAEFVAQLKKQVCQGGSRYSTFECLLTHIWKKMTLARRLGDDEMSQVRVAVNGRARMKPAVPLEYFGNLVLWAYPRLTVKELVSENHSVVAKAIHDAVIRVDNTYFQSFIDFGELSKGEGLVESAAAMGNMLCPNLEVDSWLRFEFHELDFGGGAPCAFLPSELPVEGLLLFVPSYKQKGSIDVFIAVSEDHVDSFKRIAHSLD